MAWYMEVGGSGRGECCMSVSMGWSASWITCVVWSLILRRCMLRHSMWRCGVLPFAYAVYLRQKGHRSWASSVGIVLFLWDME